MGCPVYKPNQEKYYCIGVCCICIKRYFDKNRTPPCFNPITGFFAMVLRKANLIDYHDKKNFALADDRRKQCPLIENAKESLLKKEKRNFCYCVQKDKGCAFISGYTLCCLCVERYLKKGGIPMRGSKPKCFKREWRQRRLI